MLVKDVGEKVCWRKIFTNMPLLERRDVSENYVGEACWRVFFVDEYFSPTYYFTNLLHQHYFGRQNRSYRFVSSES